jgi:Holliday junction resolvase RusA-like endonuclease
MNQIEFFVRMDPIAQGRPKFSSVGGFTRAYDPKKSRDAKSYIRLAAVEALKGKPPMEGPLVVKITSVKPIPKAASKKKTKEMLDERIVPITKPDVSNYLKLVEDALNGVAWRDDSQIVDCASGKRYGLVPGFHICVRQYELQK